MQPPPHIPGREGACGGFTFKTLHLLSHPPSLSPPAASWTLHNMSVNGVSGFGGCTKLENAPPSPEIKTGAQVADQSGWNSQRWELCREQSR